MGVLQQPYNARDPRTRAVIITSGWTLAGFLWRGVLRGYRSMNNAHTHAFSLSVVWHVQTMRASRGADSRTSSDGAQRQRAALTNHLPVPIARHLPDALSTRSTSLTNTYLRQSYPLSF
jgi:hypothetical protein